MKFAIVILSVVGVALAQFPGVPQCAIDCLKPVIGTTKCSESDIPCLCRHLDQLKGAVAPCVVKNCSSDEVSKAMDAMKTHCHV